MAATELNSPPATGALAALRLAAMALPGMAVPGMVLVPNSATAAQGQGDSISFVHEHYAEGERDLQGLSSNFQPIQVESLLGQAQFSLTDELSLGLNLSQDTWSGATPAATAPSSAQGNRPSTGAHTHTTTGASIEEGGHQHDAENDPAPSAPQAQTLTGASPYLYSFLKLDSARRPLHTDLEGKVIGGVDNQLVHTLSSASPEVRQQFDLDLRYRASPSSLSLGGGLSQERDFTAWFGHAKGSWDFNRKLTSLGAGVSYTHSKTNALLDHDVVPHVYEPYMLTYERRGDDLYNRTFSSSRLDLGKYGPRLKGDRDDWGLSLSLSQILNPSAYLTADLGFTHSFGYQSNPYKAVEVGFIDPSKQQGRAGGNLTADYVFDAELVALLEQRPDLRNQTTFNLRFVQYLQSVDAALHLGLRAYADTWGVKAQSLDAQWVQPLGKRWTLTPRLRYYSQSKADFYTAYLLTEQGLFAPVADPVKGAIYLDTRNTSNGLRYYEDPTGTVTPAIDNNPASRKYGQPVVGSHGRAIVEQGSGRAVNDQSLVDNLKQDSLPFDRSLLPQHYSSDPRLSGFGTLSAGLIASRKLNEGLKVEFSYEQLRHAGSLKLGGGGEGRYADFDAYRVNLGLTMALGQQPLLAPANLASREEDPTHHGNQHHHSQAPMAPAGVMVDHRLDKGQWMVSYRFHNQTLGGSIEQDGEAQTDYQLVNKACQGKPCYVRPEDMHMRMHMLDIMYAPTDGLTLMLMPLFLDMTMDMELLKDSPRSGGMDGIGMAITHAQHRHTSSGLGDTQLQGLFRLYQNDLLQLNMGLGLSAPTGDVSLSMRPMMGTDMGRMEYGMQLGSGTWDFLPSITLSGHAAMPWLRELYWGAQISAIERLEDQNTSGYALGDSTQGTLWGSFSLTKRLAASLRGVYTDQAPIAGAYNTTHIPIGPGDYASNYGGVFMDIGLGVSAQLGSGPFAGMNLGLEWLQPVRDKPAGYQLERQGSLVVNLRKHF